MRRLMVRASAALGPVAGEGMRWIVVGCVVNATLYSAFLLLLARGTGHMLSMTITYVAGVIAGYAMNRTWSFRFTGAVGRSFLRYAALYVVGYVANLVILYVLVNKAGARADLTQGAVIVVLAVFFFCSQKFWAFSESGAVAVGDRAR